MSKIRYRELGVSAALVILGVACSSAPRPPSVGALAPGQMPRIGTIDDRFQSYNIEMVEVTGGRFWKPYKDVDHLPLQVA